MGIDSARDSILACLDMTAAAEAACWTFKRLMQNFRVNRHLICLR